MVEFYEFIIRRSIIFCFDLGGYMWHEGNDPRDSLEDIECVLDQITVQRSYKFGKSRNPKTFKGQGQMADYDIG